MKVVFVSDHFSPPSEPGVLRTWQLCRPMWEAGDRVSVIAPSRYFPYQDGPSITETNIPMDRVEVIRIPAARARIDRGRLAEYARHLFSGTVAAWRCGSAHVFAAGLTPSFLGIGTYAVARLRRRPFVLDERDLALDAAGSLGLIRPTFLRTFRVVETFLHRHADLVIVNTYTKREILLGRGVAPEKIIVVPNGFEPTPNPTEDFSSLREKLGWHATVVFYAGGLGPSHDLDVVLDAMAFLPRGRFLFAVMGDGPDRDRLRREAERRHLPLQLLDARPKSEVGLLAAAADICVLPLPPGEHTRHVVPTKLFDYLGAGRPVVLAMEDGEAADILRKSNAGHVVPPGDPEELARAILDIADHPEKQRHMGEAGRKYVVRHHDVRTFAGRFREALLDVSRGGRPNLNGEGSRKDEIPGWERVPIRRVVPPAARPEVEHRP